MRDRLTEEKAGNFINIYIQGVHRKGLKVRFGGLYTLLRKEREFGPEGMTNWGKMTRKHVGEYRVILVRTSYENSSCY